MASEPILFPVATVRTLNPVMDRLELDLSLEPIMLVADANDEKKIRKALFDTGLDDIVGVLERDGKLWLTVPGCDQHTLMDELDFRGIYYEK